MFGTNTTWHGKPYYSLDAYLKNRYGHKCYKIAINAGMTCPNRDGTLDTRGCIFCSAGGSGDFAATGDSITTQLEQGKRLFGDKNIGEHYIAYFQAYTNTYAPVGYLRHIYTEALSHPEVCGISIATRPDCLGNEVLNLLEELQDAFPDKFLWIELGLQTIHEETASYIRRGYPLSCFEEAVKGLAARNIPYIVHVILGLPGETPNMIYRTIQYLNHLHPFGIKLQLLHILEGTDLADEYRAAKIRTYDKEEYLDILIKCLEYLSSDIIVHRLTGDGPKDILLAPRWSLNKRDVLNSLHQQMKLTNAYQGRLFHATGSIDTL
ncbi:MAG: TIGR01212 family radical SAM protein [Lachnospiraceae bacterium]|nr:TIGR01212 family radical SAM protein [Lachnospiraceae bacterium]